MSGVRAQRWPVAGPLQDLDRLLLLCVVSLVALGLVMVASASMTSADRDMGEPFYYLLRQSLYLGMGVTAGLICLSIPLDVWERSSFLLLIFAYLLLISLRGGNKPAAA